MTYFAFLAIFIGIPLAIFGWISWRDRGRPFPAGLRAFPAGTILLAHIALALFYTTPWDNYLVATGVWRYDPQLVTGITIGWVPIEEYTFFALQPILTSLWLWFLMRRLGEGESVVVSRPGLRRWAILIVAPIWLFCCFLLWSGWRPATYFSLQMAWALFPILIQLAFGADILWHYRRLLLWGILPPVLYLSAADCVAIAAGTWTIDPQQSFNFLLGGLLPVEEFTFFLMTTILIVFGTFLTLAIASRERAKL